MKQFKEDSEVTIETRREIKQYDFNICHFWGILKELSHPRNSKTIAKATLLASR